MVHSGIGVFLFLQSLGDLVLELPHEHIAYRVDIQSSVNCAETALDARYDVTHASVDFNRPFGFLAVHRPSRLAVVAGWVKSPF